jgi:hypothetical protein
MNSIREGRFHHCRHSNLEFLLLNDDEKLILSGLLNLTYIYNPLYEDPTLVLHVVYKLQH